MSLARVKVWVPGEVLTASDLNGEFNNILGNATSLISPMTAALDMNGFTLTAATLVVENDIDLYSGTAFAATIGHNNTAARTYTLPDSDGILGIPTGTILDYGAASVPTGYLKCDGTAVSRATYAALFTVIGTVWGVGDGSTTFNLPNLSRRVTVGEGGSSTSGMGTSVGHTGGIEMQGLDITMIPAHAHGGSTGQRNATHTHAGTTGNQSANHTHDVPNVQSASSGATQFPGGSPNFSTALTITTTTENAAHQHSFTTGAESEDHQHSISTEGGGGGHNNMQPSAVVYKVIKI